MGDPEGNFEGYPEGYHEGILRVILRVVLGVVMRWEDVRIRGDTCKNLCLIIRKLTFTLHRIVFDPKLISSH